MNLVSFNKNMKVDGKKKEYRIIRLEEKNEMLF